MATESYYFSHDYSARSDKNMVRLLQKEGIGGVGVFWCVVEMLYEEGGRLMLSDCESIAFALRTKEQIVKRVVINYQLFKNDGTYFWSESALRRMEARQAKSDKARESAKERWNRAKHDANALRPESEGNAIKERKGKDIKGKERITNIGEGDFFVCVDSPFPNENIYRVYDVKKYFVMKGQWEQIEKSNWGARGVEFLQSNPGRMFDDADHFYHSYKNFCTGKSAGKSSGSLVDLSKL